MYLQKLLSNTAWVPCVLSCVYAPLIISDNCIKVASYFFLRYRSVSCMLSQYNAPPDVFWILFKIACSVTKDPLDIRHDLHLVERNFSGFSDITQSYCTLLHGMIYWNNKRKENVTVHVWLSKPYEKVPAADKIYLRSRVDNNTIITLEIEDKIQWHPAFCSAMELELREYKKYLSYEREHNLGKMPLKIDFLVIRKNPGVTIKNDIGDFFLGNNIFEYKSPGDDMNIGTFYKALSYACLYKSEAGSVSEDRKSVV